MALTVDQSLKLRIRLPANDDKAAKPNFSSIELTIIIIIHLLIFIQYDL